MLLGKLSRSAIIGENESSKYWLSVLNSLKNRGVQDILILCSDGLTGIKDAISTAFPKTEQQCCMGCGLSQIMVKYLQRSIFSITPSTIRDFARSPQREKSPVRASKTRQAAKGKVIGKFEKINSHNQYQRGNGQKKIFPQGVHKVHFRTCHDEVLSHKCAQMRSIYTHYIMCKTGT